MKLQPIWQGVLKLGLTLQVYMARPSVFLAFAVYLPRIPEGSIDPTARLAVSKAAKIDYNGLTVL